jgi:hypothetical protein
MVMNVSIHSVLLDKPPCKNTREADIIAWLSGGGGGARTSIHTYRVATTS